MKKQLSVFLFGALLLGAAGTFTSCKDYDDDIANLQGQIDGQASDLQSKLEGVNSAISSLQSAQSGVQSAIDEAKDAAEAAAAAAQAAAIEAAKAQLESVKAELEAAIAASTGDIDELKAAAQAAETDMAEAKGRIEALESFQTNTEKSLKNLLAADQSLETSITELSEETKKTLEEHGRRLAAIEAQIEALNHYNDSVNLEGQIDDVRKQLLGLDSLEEAVSKVDSLLAAYKVTNDAEIESLKKQLTDALAKLENADTGLQGEVADLQKQLDALKNGQLGDMSGLTDEIVKKVEEALLAEGGEISKLNDKIDLLSQALGKKVTHVSLVVKAGDAGAYTTLNLVSAEARRTWVFGGDYTGAVQFTKGAKETFEDDFLLRVSPVNAVLDADSIKLVDSALNDLEASNLVDIVSVEPYKEQLTAPAPTRGGVSANGVWKVTVKLHKDYSTDAYKKAATKKVNGADENILYAVMVGGSRADERQIVSEYGIILGQDNKGLEKELSFKVGDILVDEIHNRWDGSAPTTTEGNSENPYEELAWKAASVGNENAPFAEPVTDATNRNYNVQADAPDARNVKPAFRVDVNTPFTVTLQDDAAAANIRAFYVTYDYKECAVESQPSEWNAWTSYTIEGLNTVTSESSITLNVTSPAADGDYIGLRVFAVNYDGSLVDPDGKAFYIYVGGVAQQETVFGVSIPDSIRDPQLTTDWESRNPNRLGFSTSKWGTGNQIEIKVTEPDGSDVTTTTGITIDNLYFKDGHGAPVTMTASDNTATTVSLRNLDPTKLKDGVEYTITITVTNTMTGIVAQGIIKFTKTMPNFPAEVYPFTNVLDNNTLKVYPYFDGTNAVYDMTSVWHGLTLNDAPVAGLTLSQTGVDAGDETITYPEGTTTIVAPIEAVDPEIANSTEYPMQFSYDYGQISFRPNNARPAAYEVQNWLTYSDEFNIVLGNYVDDCIYEMTPGVSVNYPGAVGAEATIPLRSIAVTDWYGDDIDLSAIIDQDTDTKEGRYFDVYSADAPFKIQFLTGENFDKEDEFFIFNRIEGTNIVMTANSEGAVGGNVDTKIRLTFKDKFGYEVKKDVEGVFTMKYQK